MAKWNQMFFQDASSPIMTQLIMLHDHAMMILTLVICVVSSMMISLIWQKFTCRNIMDAQSIEIIWTILPAIILQMLALPSLRLLYLMDELKEPDVTLKVTGHQWYWSYGYTTTDINKNISTFTFDSYMIPTNELKSGQYRLLEVDHRAVLPYNKEIRFIITSADVIHAFSLPSLGVKVDAVPGRLNQTGVTISQSGIYYGQCSEICGANHSFMPIVVEAISYKSYNNWINKMINA